MQLAQWQKNPGPINGGVSVSGKIKKSGCWAAMRLKPRKEDDGTGQMGSNSVTVGNRNGCHWPGQRTGRSAARGEGVVTAVDLGGREGLGPDVTEANGGDGGVWRRRSSFISLRARQNCRKSDEEAKKSSKRSGTERQAS